MVHLGAIMPDRQTLMDTSLKSIKSSLAPDGCFRKVDPGIIGYVEET